MGKLTRHLTYSNVMVTALAVVVLGGAAYAASTLPRNSVRSKNIVNGQVKTHDLAAPQRLKSAGLLGNESFNCANAPNQWASSRPSVNGVVGYYRDLSGVVHLSGDAALCGSPSTGGTIFILPVGYRPGTFKDEAAVNNGNYVEVTVDPQGDVGVPAAISGAIVALDGVSFRCAPSGKHGCN